MTPLPKLSIFDLLLSTTLLIAGCQKEKNTDTLTGKCRVQLFDGDHFKDDNVIIKGEGIYADLSNLPNTDKDWTDEADAIKVGSKTTLTIWTNISFQGDSTVYQSGNYPSVSEPSSIRITCD